MTAASHWIDRAPGLDDLDPETRRQLEAVRPITIPKGQVLFRPGDEVTCFGVLIGGRVDVYLTGATGREILLYSITPGESCVQSTLGLLGENDYSAEAVAETDVEAVMIPKSLFLGLLGRSEAFRTFVFQSFAKRLQSVMQVLERVAFIRIEERLAAALLERADHDGVVRTTHQELATAIGSVREVVSRRLEALARKGFVSLDRGTIRVADRAGLAALIS
ncbi:Crp/Fnr family transcriptional regulator [Thalassospiraceae bacterium LMO-SO8]|nr:Crp/Fnr family transcriptional regulator [Alphaproteobacteria bacterium LMO-S08]WND75238.1 Crp/Fnr family transcriptional regulator [Thalassospiraceae bacterium LMO-SO8]